MTISLLGNYSPFHNSWLPRALAFALVCLSSTGHGRRAYIENRIGNAPERAEHRSSIPTATLRHPTHELRQTLFAYHPIPRPTPFGGRVQPLARSVDSAGDTQANSARRIGLRFHAKHMSLSAKSKSGADGSFDSSTSSAVDVPTNPTDFSVVFLLGAAALWGTYPTAIKLLFNAPGAALNPAEISLARYLVMGSASYAAFSITSDSSSGLPQSLQNITWDEQLRRRVPSSSFVAALELGAIGLVGSYFNVFGLQRIPGLTGAVFLTFLNVFTPLQTALFGATEKERSVDTITWFTCLLAFGAATFALLPDASSGAVAASNSLLTLGEGELAVLIAAFFFAAVKVRLSSLLKFHDVDQLSTGRLVAQAGLAAAGLGLVDETNLLHELLPNQQGGMGMSLSEALMQAEGWLRNVSPEQMLLIVVSALLSGSFATWCQGKGQAKVSAPRAQLFYATSPIFAALWASLLLSEPITNHEILGGVVLLLGLVSASLASDSGGE